MAIIERRDSACARTVQEQKRRKAMYFDFFMVHFNLVMTDVDRNSHYLTYLIEAVEGVLYGKALTLTALEGHENVVLQCLATDGKTMATQVITDPNAFITQHPCRLQRDTGPLRTLRGRTLVMF